MNNQDLVNEIRQKIDIVDLISEYIPLVQKGKNYFGVYLCSNRFRRRKNQ